MYESLEDRMRAVVIVFALIAVVALVAVVADFLQMHLATRLEEGYAVSRHRNDARQAGIRWVELVLFVSGAAVFVRWLWGAYHNVDVVAPGTRRFDHGWAIGGWFVPVLNLWRPKQVVNDVWAAGGLENSVLLLSWWIAWLVASFMMRLALGHADTTPADMHAAAGISGLAHLLWAAAAVLALLTVREATRRLDRVAAQGSVGHLHGTPVPQA